MIEVAVLLLYNPVFMESEISMHDAMYFGRLMNVYGTDVLLICNTISLSPYKLTRISATGRMFRNVEPFDRAPSMLAELVTVCCSTVVTGRRWTGNEGYEYITELAESWVTNDGLPVATPFNKLHFLHP